MAASYASGVIRAPRALREFPNPEELSGLTPIANARLFAGVPWLLPGSYRDKNLVNEYVIADMLPDGLPVCAIECDDWARRCVVPDHALLRSRATRGEVRRATIGEARVSFTKLVYQRLNRFPGQTVIPTDFGFDPFVYRTYGETVYGPALADILELADDWKGQTSPRQEALGFRRPLLRAEFRFTRRRDDAEFAEMIRWERRIRSRIGYLVPYQMVEVQSLTAAAKRTRYVALPDHWADFETPRGFMCDLPPVLTYAGRHMINNPSSGVWVVFYTEWVAKVAAALLWEAYDNYRIFYLHPVIRESIKTLELGPVLGSPSNYQEVLSFVEVIDQTNWDSVPAMQQQRGHTNKLDMSPGKSDASGDWVFYDPWHREIITADQAKVLRDKTRDIPENHRRGYSYSSRADPSGLHPELLDNSDDEVLDDADIVEADGEEPEAMETEAPAPSGEGAVVVTPAVSSAAGGSSNAPAGGTGNPGVPSFSGSGMTWLQSVRDGRAGSQLAFLRGFLRDAGLAVDPDVGDLQALLNAVKTQVARRSGGPADSGVQKPRSGRGPGGNDSTESDNLGNSGAAA